MLFYASRGIENDYRCESSLRVASTRWSGMTYVRNLLASELRRAHEKTSGTICEHQKKV